LKQFVIVERRY